MLNDIYKELEKNGFSDENTLVSATYYLPDDISHYEIVTQWEEPDSNDVVKTTRRNDAVNYAVGAYKYACESQQETDVKIYEYYCLRVITIQRKENNK